MRCLLVLSTWRISMHDRTNNPDWFLDKVRKTKMTEKTKGVVTKAFKDIQVGGDHYKKHTIQPWDIIDEYNLGYYGGNALKYLLRDKSNRKEDLEKARHYIDKMIGDLE